ncbi:MAG: oxidoreductase [Burkholderiales bacterium]|nr:oxidoreductase [Burkholderiales bacterium]
MAAALSTAADPPVPPIQPEPADCCRSGCDPCIFDRYNEALVRYEAELAAWQSRQNGAKKDATVQKK